VQAQVGPSRPFIFQFDMGRRLVSSH
jgi:hypothetical protein